MRNEGSWIRWRGYAILPETSVASGSGLAPSGRPINAPRESLVLFPKASQKIYAKSLLAEMEICERYSFIQCRKHFPEDAAACTRLCSDSYNQERIQYEPEYSSIAPHVGVCKQEVQTRKIGLAPWLRGKVNPETGFPRSTMAAPMEYFLPDLPGRKYVFDISDIALADGITRVKSESELGYPYIQLRTVLIMSHFHWLWPKKAASFLDDSGHLCIEVPQELCDEVRAQLASRGKNIRLTIHEHINQYCLSSVTDV
jgi:hypothetical protein